MALRFGSQETVATAFATTLLIGSINLVKFAQPVVAAVVYDLISVDPARDYLESPRVLKRGWNRLEFSQFWRELVLRI